MDTQEEEKDKSHRREPGPLFEMSRRILLAGIGAMALAQDEVEAFVNRLIERGEVAEKDGKALIKEIREKRKKHLQAAEDEAASRVKTILDRLNIPTRHEIQALSEQIAALNRKLDETRQKPPQA